MQTLVSIFIIAESLEKKQYRQCVVYDPSYFVKITHRKLRKWSNQVCVYMYIYIHFKLFKLYMMCADYEKVFGLLEHEVVPAFCIVA